MNTRLTKLCLQLSDNTNKKIIMAALASTVAAQDRIARCFENDLESVCSLPSKTLQSTLAALHEDKLIKIINRSKIASRRILIECVMFPDWELEGYWVRLETLSPERINEMYKKRNKYKSTRPHSIITDPDSGHLIFPEGFNLSERTFSISILSDIPPHLHQSLLDELKSLIDTNKVRGSAINKLYEIACKVKKDLRLSDETTSNNQTQDKRIRNNLDPNLINSIRFHINELEKLKNEIYQLQLFDQDFHPT